MTIKRFSLVVALTLACALVCVAQEQSKQEATNASTTDNSSTTENAIGPISGEGTTGKIPKFTGTNSIGDSIITESSGRLGVSTPVAPSAKLHVHVPGLQSLPGDGTDATSLLQTSGGKGGNTTGAAAGTQTAGAGASIFLMAGQGGDAGAGNFRGNGGSITLQPGGTGGGTGFSGTSGNVLLAPNGIGLVGIGTNAPISGKLHVDGGSNVAVYGQTSISIGVHGFSTSNGNGVRGQSLSNAGVYGISGSGWGVYGQSTSGTGVFGISSTGLAGEFDGKVRVQGGDVFIANPNSLVITSPNGACWQIRVSNAGALAAASVTCP